MAASKAQHALLAVPLALLILFDPNARAGVLSRSLAAMLVFGAAAIPWYFVPNDYRVGPAYNVIFMEILPHSQSVDRDLAELGLDPSYRRYIGTHAYHPESVFAHPELVPEIAPRLSHLRIARFLLNHPRRGLLAIAHGMDNAGQQRAAMGDFERSTGRAPFSQARTLAPWSNLKEAIFRDRGWLYLAYTMAVCCAAILGSWKTRYRPGAMCLAAMTMLALCVTTLGDVLEPARHAFILNVLIDVMFAAAIVSAARGLTARRVKRT